MGKRIGAALVAVGLVAGITATADAEEVTLPGGTSLTVDVSASVGELPVANGGSIDFGSTLTVTGTATVGVAPAPEKNTDLVFVLDTSGSTANQSNIACGTILACEKAAVLTLVEEAQAPRSPINQIGVAAFPNSTTLPLGPPDIAATSFYLEGLSPSGGTNFSLGIDRAQVILESSNAATKLIVLLTDGDGTSNETAPIGAIVLAFTIAPQGVTPPGCDGLANVLEFAIRPVSSCTVVENIANLPGVIQEIAGSTLESVKVTVNGVEVPAIINPPLPAPGPATANFTAAVTDLAVGPRVVCATATGSDANGPGLATECLTVNVLPAGTVTCPGGICTNVRSVDPGKSTLLFNSNGIDAVTIRPETGQPGECGVQACKTGYFIGFPLSLGEQAVATLTVTTVDRVRLRDRLNAAQFLDQFDGLGYRQVTAQCNNRKLIAAIRNWLGIPEPIPCITIRYLRTGQLEYFLKFNADPGWRAR